MYLLVLSLSIAIFVGMAVWGSFGLMKPFVFGRVMVTVCFRWSMWITVLPGQAVGFTRRQYYEYLFTCYTTPGYRTTERDKSLFGAFAPSQKPETLIRISAAYTAAVGILFASLLLWLGVAHASW